VKDAFLGWGEVDDVAVSPLSAVKSLSGEKKGKWGRNLWSGKRFLAELQ